jgi:AraC-like DNA-binding protein
LGQPVGDGARPFKPTLLNKTIEDRGVPSSAVRTFTDPDHYTAAIRGAKAEVIILGRGQFTAQITRIDLHNVWLQRLADSLPRTGYSAFSPDMAGRAVFSFRTAAGPTVLWNGSEAHPTTVLRHNADESNFQRTSGSFSWGFMSLPAEELAVLEAVAGCELTPPKRNLTATPSPRAMARLQRVHAAVGKFAEKTPEIIANPEAARGIEQALIEALVRCLDNGAVGEDRAALRRHTLILRRFHQLVEENADQPIYIAELCRAIGVSDRTLRVCCEEQLGINPKRYLTLRRMRLARQALRDGAPGSTTVTETATQFGFWQFGWFAGNTSRSSGNPRLLRSTVERSRVSRPALFFRDFCRN